VRPGDIPNRLLATLSTSSGAIWAVAITGDGELLALALDDGSVSVVGLPR
jgi:hypothetical protein